MLIQEILWKSPRSMQNFKAKEGLIKMNIKHLRRLKKWISIILTDSNHECDLTGGNVPDETKTFPAKEKT